MNTKRYALWTSTIVAASLLLSGCQLLTGYQKINEAESAEAWVGKIKPIAGEVNIACVGTYHCEIVQIDKTLIIAPNSHEPINPQIMTALPRQEGMAKTSILKKHIILVKYWLYNRIKILVRSKKKL